MKKHPLFLSVRIGCLVWCLATLAANSGVAAVSAVPEDLRIGIEATYHARIKDAYEAINRYISAHPNDPLGYAVRGTTGEWEQKLHNLRGKISKKIIDDYETSNQIAFRAYDRDPENIDNLVNLGNSYIRLGKKWGDEGHWMRAALISKKCYRHLADAIARDKERWDAYMSLGAFHYFAANLPNGAKPFASLLGIKGDRAQGTQEIKIGAEHPNLFQADALYLLKYVYRKEKEFQKTFDILNRLHKTYPENPEISYDLGVAYGDLKQYDKGVPHLEAFAKECEKTSKSSDGCNDRYRYLSFHLIGDIQKNANHPNEAIAAYKKAAELHTAAPAPRDYARLLFNLGTVYESQKAVAEAKATYTEAAGITDKGAKEWRERAAAQLATLH